MKVISFFSSPDRLDNWYEYYSLFSSFFLLIESWGFSFPTLNFGGNGTVCL